MASEREPDLLRHKSAHRKADAHINAASDLLEAVATNLTLAAEANEKAANAHREALDYHSERLTHTSTRLARINNLKARVG